MHRILHPSRREFLKCVAAAGLAVAGRACAQDTLPPPVPRRRRT
ncbi:MAG TPA: twin-arginine translocation signal domain-containing protein [Candidatus Hydrogenedentes bacterium]|nr:twin-arginine translocation signal domain-containing protein [Candidatus Hydrogenedentota bacterium]